MKKYQNEKLHPNLWQATSALQFMFYYYMVDL
jgi:hypothetical protein